ncbi:MAG: SRPBCC family protein [Bacteroidia bacterium]
MKILKILGIVLLGLMAIIVLLGLIAPKDFKVERSIVIPTSNKEVIFKNLSNWSDFLKWNPWSSKDPNQKLTYKGEEGTVGASYKWEGNDSVGCGEMTIVALVPNKKVDMDLHFIKPFETTNKTIFTMVPQGDGYNVNWEMSGSSPFPFNIMHLFMDMDKMIGPDFEKGLNTLKEKALTEAAASLPVAEDASLVTTDKATTQ